MKPYGFIKPTIAVGTNVESYGQPNAEAIVAALNPVFSSRDTNRFYTFELAQTRLGLLFNKIPQITGKIEMDFFDAGKASPTVASVPRLRIAKLEIHLSKEHHIYMGQDWDLFSPLVPHTFNWVGAFFEAGNSGFMRHQLQYRYTGRSLDAGFSIGLIGSNNNPSFGDIEKGAVPTFAGRLGFKLGNKALLGVSVIGSLLRFGGARDAVFVAANLYGDFNPTPTLNIRVEGYVGQNTYNTGLLTLAQGTATNDVRDAGGYLSIKQSFLENHAVMVMGGVAHVLNADAMPLGYSPAAGATSAVRTTATGPGIIRNTVVRLGYEYRPLRGLGVILEAFYYNTWHKLAPADLAVRDPGSVAYGIETGMIYFF